MVKRITELKRKTKEVEIDLKLNIDGEGKTHIDTGIGLLDHMLELFTFHGLFDLDLKAKTPKKIDLHHTNEDIGIVLGEAFKKGLKNKKGINRFGFFSVPMEDNLATVILDICGRGYFKLKIEGLDPYSLKDQEGYSLKEMEHLLDAFAKNLGMNLYVKIETSLNKDIHSIMEPVFKALGIALKQATSKDPRRKNIPSTKGIID
jgi:imidazoleglycerol-phosphate dehydratase